MGKCLSCVEAGWLPFVWNSSLRQSVFGQRLSGLHFYDLMTQITQFLPLTAQSQLGTEERQIVITRYTQDLSCGICICTYLIELPISYKTKLRLEGDFSCLYLSIRGV